MDAVAAVIEVQGARGAYPVVLAPGALERDLPRFVRERGFSQVVIITNDVVGPLYGDALARRLPGASLISVPDGEHHKTLDSVRELYSTLLAHGADRGTLIVALGGGVVGDMAGFAAASFMRGVPLIQAPTSLLAMVDASVGGKVGVDLPEGKNLVGAFKDPLAVFVDSDTLRTLPEVEFRCGMAEVLKAGLIADVRLFEELSAGSVTDVVPHIQRAIRVKADVVAQDRLEQGMRAYLNLGHTFAHAIEQVSGYAWRHGEAVSVGLVAAAHLSARRELCDPGLPACVERAVAALGLPIRCDLDPAALWDAMRHDKKWQAGAARFVLLRAVGQPVLCDDVPRAHVIEVLESWEGA